MRVNKEKEGIFGDDDLNVYVGEGKKLAYNNKRTF